MPSSKSLYILDPDNHTYGWLTVSELKECIAAHNSVEKELYLDKKVLFEMMNTLAKYYGVSNVRFVFWFDN